MFLEKANSRTGKSLLQKTLNRFFYKCGSGCWKMLLQLSFASNPAFYFNMEKSYEDIYHSPTHVSVITGNILMAGAGVKRIFIKTFHFLLTISRKSRRSRGCPVRV